MRVSEDRYTRDLRRINLARRMIRYEVRTQSICAWTGLSDERIRNLYHSYEPHGTRAERHRGPSPTRVATLLRSPTLRSEASAIAGLACVLGLIPSEPLANARQRLPGVALGERVCCAFELYRHMVPQSTFAMDQFILLIIALAERRELEMSHCASCHAALLVEHLSTSRRICQSCKQYPFDQTLGAAEKPGESEAEKSESPDPYQQPLF